MFSKQQSFFDSHSKAERKAYKGRNSHGGNTKGQRKRERPLAKKKWIHLILKSERAKGLLSFQHPRNKQAVEKIIKEKAKKFGVQIADGVNMGNHFHLKIKITNREQFQKFLKAITCLIARHVTGARRGKPFGKFWQGLAFTRVLKTSLEELQLKGYFKANREQKHSYQKREEFLKDFNRWIGLLKAQSENSA